MDPDPLASCHPDAKHVRDIDNFAQSRYTSDIVCGICMSGKSDDIEKSQAGKKTAAAV